MILHVFFCFSRGARKLINVLSEQGIAYINCIGLLPVWKFLGGLSLKGVQRRQRLGKKGCSESEH